jgi:hypothetical protein
MSKDKNAKATEAAPAVENNVTNNDNTASAPAATPATSSKFVVETGEAPAAISASRGGNGDGIKSIVKALQVGQWFRLARIKKGDSYRRDGSRSYAAKEAATAAFGSKDALEFRQISETEDVVKRVK